MHILPRARESFSRIDFIHKKQSKFTPQKIYRKEKLTPREQKEENTKGLGSKEVKICQKQNQEETET